MTGTSTRRWARPFAFALVAAGIALAAIGGISFELVRSRLDTYSGDGSADRYSPSLHLRLQWSAFALGGALALLGLGFPGLSDRLQRRGLTARVAQDLRSLSQDGMQTLRSEWPLLAILAGLSAATRIPWLHLPIRYDEAHSWLEYAAMPWFVTIAKYDDPNNHVLHNLMLSLVANSMGSEPWQLRIPALFAGVLIAPLSYLVCRRWTGTAAALTAGLICVGSSPLIEYSVNARGYTWFLVWTLSVYGFAEHGGRTDNAASALGCVGAGALGLWTVPTMILGLAPVWVWMALLSPTRPRIVATTSVALLTCGLALLLYSPILLTSAPWQRFAVTHSAADADPAGVDTTSAAARPERTGGLRQTLQLLFRDLPETGIVVLLGLMVLACWPPYRETRPVPLLLLANLIGPIALWILGIEPPARAWLFAVPLWAVAAAVGLERLARQGDKEHPPDWALALLFATFLAGYPWILMMHRETPVHSTETGICPDARTCLERLSITLGPQDRIVAVAPASAPLVYEARRLRLPASLFDFPAAGQPCCVIVSNVAPQTCHSVLNQLGLIPVPELNLSSTTWQPTPDLKLATVAVYRVTVAPNTRSE